MKQTDIEILRKKGYTEAEIQIAVDTLSKLTISPQELEALGKNRDDRTVVASSSDGKSMKTSSIMMGYNKAGISLENGDYVSIEEFTEALTRELSTSSKDTIYVSRKTGRKIDSADLIKQVLKEASKDVSNLNLSETNSISNQGAMAISIEDAKKKKEFKKGVLMLGNPSLTLPNGEYVLASEILKAMDDYVKMVPGEVVITEAPVNKPTKEEKYRVIKRITKRMSLLPIIIALISTLLTGFRVEEKYDKVFITTPDTVATISIDSLIEKSEEEILAEVTKKVMDIKTGDKIEVNDGLEYHSSSDYKYGGDNKTGVFGENNPVGEYNVDYISIIHNGQIVHTKFNKDESLEKNLALAAEKLGVDVSTLESYIHLGGPVSGWVSTGEIISSSANKISSNKSAILDKKDNINGTIDNFNGSTITIKDGEEEVSLKVVDDEGNLLSNGEIVTGSNGKKYRLQNISLESNLKTTEKDVYAGKHLTWSIHNVSKEFALLSAAAATMFTLLSNRERKEMVTMTSSQIDYLVRTAREKFENESEFQRAVTTITNKSIDEELTASETLKHDLISQNITVEDINSLGGFSK